MLKLIGVLLILNSLVLTSYWVLGEHSNKGWAVLLCSGAIFVGILLIVQHRRMELSVPYFGKLKAAADQADIDAKAISDIKNRIEGQSATVDLVAKDVADAKDEINFNLLLTKASNDNRFALDELHKIEMTEGHRFQETARQAVEQIIVNLQIVVIYKDFLDLKKKYNIDPEEASLNDFHKVFEQGPLYDKIDVLTIVWSQKKRFTKAERIEVLYKVITTTPSIRILFSACGLMDKEAKLGKNFILDHAQYAKWWEENREGYPEDQPTAEQEQ